MSMEKFLRDIEARLASERAWDMEQDARQVARVQYSTITLDDRLLAQVGGPIRICATDMQTYEGKLEMVGEEWVSIEARGENIIIPLRGMLWWEGGIAPGRADIRPERYRMKIQLALRSLAMAREPVRLSLEGGTVSYDGVIERSVPTSLNCACSTAASTRASMNATSTRVQPTARREPMVRVVMGRLVTVRVPPAIPVPFAAPACAPSRWLVLAQSSPVSHAKSTGK